MEENNMLTHLDSQESWESARRSVLVQKVICTFKNCSLDEGETLGNSEGGTIAE